MSYTVKLFGYIKCKVGENRVEMCDTFDNNPKNLKMLMDLP